MQWQDWVLSVGALVFAASLIPSITSQDKPAALTSVITAGVLFVFSFVYLSLSLWLSVITTVLLATLWTILAAQKLRQNR